jgi:putative ABC transport system permease protein
MNDLKHSVRMLLRSPGFTIAAVAALTLGIGAATAIFSVINTVLLKPLTYPDTSRIVQFYLSTPNGPDAGGSPARFNALSLETRAFEDVTAYEYSGIGLNLTGGAYPEQVRAIHVSAGYFRLFGAPMILGRAFTAAEDRPHAGRVAVLSYGLWQRRFASDPAIIGKTISLSAEPHTVVGVIGPGFRTELDTPPDVWIPFQIDPVSSDNARYFGIAGRLRPRVTEQMATAQLALAMQEFRRRSPNQAGPRDEFRVQPLQDALVANVRPSLLVLAGAVSLLLLIAIVNVAHLLLVRAAARKREIAVRTALGADRGRILRQLLTESLVLSLASGALGLALGMAGIRALLAIQPGKHSSYRPARRSRLHGLARGWFYHRRRARHWNHLRSLPRIGSLTR